jgi:hypothetical protein
VLAPFKDNGPAPVLNPQEYAQMITLLISILNEAYLASTRFDNLKDVMSLHVTPIVQELMIVSNRSAEGHLPNTLQSNVLLVNCPALVPSIIMAACRTIISVPSLVQQLESSCSTFLTVPPPANNQQDGKCLKLFFHSSTWKILLRHTRLPELSMDEFFAESLQQTAIHVVHLHHLQRLTLSCASLSLSEMQEELVKLLETCMSFNSLFIATNSQGMDTKVTGSQSPSDRNASSAPFDPNPVTKLLFVWRTFFLWQSCVLSRDVAPLLEFLPPNLHDSVRSLSDSASLSQHSANYCCTILVELLRTIATQMKRKFVGMLGIGGYHFSPRMRLAAHTLMAFMLQHQTGQEQPSAEQKHRSKPITAFAWTTSVCLVLLSTC